MEDQKVIDIFKETGVMLEGHFLLTSGMHSNRYFQCARLFEYPVYSELLCSELEKKFSGDQVELVIGPALGGVIMAYEVSRALGVKNIFAERENGVMTIRRGFFVPKGTRTLVVEDVVTTGGSVKEVIGLLDEMEAQVVGVGCMMDRSAGRVQFGCKFESLVRMDIEAYHAEGCPICKTGLPLVKPGSRSAKK
ncbi:MAG: orotate phosphoribosyltransferase [Christensenellales bacterium]